MLRRMIPSYVHESVSNYSAARTEPNYDYLKEIYRLVLVASWNLVYQQPVGNFIPEFNDSRVVYHEIDLLKNFQECVFKRFPKMLENALNKEELAVKYMQIYMDGVVMLEALRAVLDNGSEINQNLESDLSDELSTSHTVFANYSSLVQFVRSSELVSSWEDMAIVNDIDYWIPWM